jgi:hypothetical protein
VGSPFAGKRDTLAHDTEEMSVIATAIGATSDASNILGLYSLLLSARA